MSAASPTSISRGAVLTISMRWTDRLIGFVSTLILARLLAPEDFGIIAMASLVVGLADVFLNLGVNVALIQNQDTTPSHYNTAWTLRLIQTAISAALLLVFSPFAAGYFGDPRVVPVLQLMALGMLLVGLENIGVITFQKEMRFGLDFRFMFLKRLVGFLVTILAAWLLRSYWALVLGALVGRAFGVMLSYQMHPMRPRLSFEKVKEIFSVSQWMLVNSIGSYLHLNLHKILVGRRATTTIMGGYTLADEISGMPTGEVLAPLNRVLFPAFVQVKHDLVELKRIFLLAQGVQTLLAIPASVGLALVAREAVIVLLGEKWLFISPYVQMLALASVIQAITTSGSYVMLTMGAHRAAAVITWVQVIFFMVAVFLVIPNSDALQIASLRVVTVFAGLSLAVWMLMRTLGNVSVTEIFFTILRPLLGTGLMTIAVLFVGSITQFNPGAALLLKVGTGLLTYPVAVVLMWGVAGKPAGAESYVLEKLTTLIYRK
ncbi:MAG: lipopolysaccharide biosynthesis protein [Anaerolineaceae bacterium]|nr:lipopolysaccharide biosynthesis protein [Anaerolineaceae bacterium]